MLIPEELDDRGYLDSAKLKARYSDKSDMWIARRLANDPDFPKPLIIERRRFWKLSELQKWEKLRAAGPPKAPVKESRRKRVRA